jgi:paraquat-inducible protein B
MNNKKEKRLRKLIQKPLRFHHQDIHDELMEIKRTLHFQNECLQDLSQALSLNAQFLLGVLEDKIIQPEDADSEPRDSKDIQS